MYIQAGWTGTLPLPLGAKFPPPEGFTGAGGATPEIAQVLAWAQAGPAYIGLRLPAGVVGIDVDHYDGKPGADTLAELMAELGPLPATWSSTSRGADSPARVWLYRLPQADVTLRGKAGLGIDVLQHHHRYIVAAPSVHPEGGVYAWYRPDFTSAAPGELPLVADLPFLPETWVSALAERQERPMPPAVPGEQHADGWSQFMARPPQSLTAARAAIARELAAASAPATPGSGYRHVLMRAALTLGGYVAAGVLDAATAYSGLEDAAGRAWGNEPDADDARWIRDGLADGQRRPFKVWDDSGYAAGSAGQPALPPRALASLEHVRSHGRLADVFDPAEDNTDHGLAQSVLAELYPNLRMDSESGSWLVRGPERWQTITRDASGWAVTEVAVRMPYGARPVPKDPSERTAEHWQGWRHQRFHSSAGSAPVAKKIRELTAAGSHPNHVRLSELDADPAILWAGGRPWDLRTCALADGVDPLTPHTHSARFEPVEGPTPLWDAFVAAVWPDAEIREWALRVLAVGLTGHSPRIMPVLYGDTGRGKTQVVALLCNLLGTYGGPADQKLIVAPEAHGSVVYSLKGLRLAYIDEPAPTHRDKVERVKLLTGGGRMTGNQMRRDPVTWDSTHTLVLMQNDAPELTDDALRDRARVIACDGDPDQVSRARAALGEVAGDTISGAWAREAPGVLAAMMRRASAWLADSATLAPSATPAAVAELVETMVREQDPVRLWMDERTVAAEPGTPAQLLHNDFAVWFRNHPAFGRRAVLSSVDFGRRLTKAGVGLTRTAETRYRHLELKQNPGGNWFTGPAPEPVPAAGKTMTGDDTSVTDAESGSVIPSSQVSTQVDHEMTDVMDGSPVTFHHHLNQVSTYNSGIPEPVSDPSVDSANSVSDQGELAMTGDSADPSSGLAPVHTSVHRQHSKAPLSANYASLRRQEREATEKSAEPEPPAKPKRTRRQPGEPTPVQARKAAEKAARVAELAGETVELPAVVRRTTPTPRHVDHVHVGPLLTDAMAKSDGHLTVDVETSGYPIGHPDYALRTVQLGTRVLAVDLDADCTPCCAVATAALGRAQVLHAHNAHADIPALHHAGIATHAELWAKMDDTVIGEKLADPSGGGGNPALKAASAVRLGAQATSPAAEERRKALFTASGWLTETEPTTPAEKSGWLQVDKRSSTMISYACSDVLDGALLALTTPAPDPAVHEREKRVQRIVAPAATFGFPLDAALVRSQHDDHDAAEQQLRQQVRSALGIDNPGSPKQLGEAFTRMGVSLPHTPGGAPSTAKDVLHTLAERSGPAQAAARLVLDWRHHDTLLKLILRPWLIAVERGDGRVRPTVYTLGADTGRMSCVRPNMQQISKKGGVRECVLADAGFAIVSADFEGVELRVAAALSGDPVLRSVLEQGLDIHRMIAAQVFGEALADENRTLAKRIVFGYIYGGGFETLAKQSGVSVEIVAAAVDALRALTPRLAAWSEEIKQGVRTGLRQWRTYSGRVIHLDPKLPHKAPNYLIQGTARELLADALLEWDDASFGGGVLMPVHDEIVAMVPQDQAQLGLDTLLGVMTRQLGDIAITAEAGGPPARSWHSG